MLGNNVNVLRRGWLAVALLTVVGCGPSEEIQQQLAQLEIVSAQKDSLIEAVAEYAQVMSVISAELADIQMEGRDLMVAVESPVAASRDSILNKIRYINERVAQTEARLRQSRQRVSALTSLSDSLRATMEQTYANYEGLLASQRESLAALTEQVTGLEAEKQQLAAEITTLEDAAAKVYYIIGTEEELLERGIIQKEGGSRVLFIFGKRGQTLVPGRDLDPGDFTMIDRRDATEIEFPNPDAVYTVVSRHDLAYLENTPDEKGNISGSLRISSPNEFWAASPFLIVVEKS
jgi:hypothetical protein